MYSARFAGEPKDDQANIDKVLQELNEIPFDKRKARFYCALAVAFPEGDKKACHCKWDVRRFYFRTTPRGKRLRI